MKVGQNNAEYIMQHWADDSIGERERELINEYREKNNISDEEYAEIRETCNKRIEDRTLYYMKLGRPEFDYEDENTIDFLKKHDVSDEEINEARETAAKERKNILQQFPDDANEICPNIQELDNKYEEGNKKRLDELTKKTCDEVLGNKDTGYNANAANVSRFNSRFDKGMNLSSNVQKAESEIESDYGLKN